jgi:hypothetical protein
VTLSGGGVIQAHFWSEPATDAEGFIALHATRQRLQAPTARFGALRRSGHGGWQDLSLRHRPGG